MKKPAHFHCPQSFLQTRLPELGAVAGIKCRQPGAAGQCLLPTCYTTTPASLSHAVPWRAARHTGSPRRSPQCHVTRGQFPSSAWGKKKPKWGMQFKNPTLTRSLCAQKEQYFQRGQAVCELKACQGIFPIKYFPPENNQNPSFSFESLWNNSYQNS